MRSCGKSIAWRFFRQPSISWAAFLISRRPDLIETFAARTAEVGMVGGISRSTIGNLDRRSSENFFLVSFGRSSKGHTRTWPSQGRNRGSIPSGVPAKTFR